VTIRAEASEEHALLVFEDNGNGISPDDLQHLFDPFFTRNQHQGGTGLGLSIVHGIISDHGGQIIVTSEPGEATRFIVRLPLWSENTQA
jgi:signal transduction histidine kinase